MVTEEEKKLIIWSSFQLPNRPPFPYHMGADRDTVRVESIDAIPEFIYLLLFFII